jgi:hypothetical protein
MDDSRGQRSLCTQQGNIYRLKPGLQHAWADARVVELRRAQSSGRWSPGFSRSAFVDAPPSRARDGQSVSKLHVDRFRMVSRGGILVGVPASAGLRATTTSARMPTDGEHFCEWTMIGQNTDRAA